jgi:hypothetical protein
LNRQAEAKLKLPASVVWVLCIGSFNRPIHS